MNAITTKINAIVGRAPQSDKDELAQVMEDYAAKYARTYTGLRRVPFVRDLLDDLEENTDARIEPLA